MSKNYGVLTGTRESIVDGDILWMISLYIDALLKIDLKRNRLEAAYFMDDEYWGVYAHHTLEKCDGKIYVFPNFSNSIYQLDIATGEFRKLRTIMEEPHLFRFCVCNENDKKIFLFGQKETGVYVYDPRCNAIEKIDGITEAIRENGVDLKSNPIFIEHCIYDNKVYAPIAWADLVFVLDVLNNKWEIVRNDKWRGFEFQSINICQNGLLMATRNDEGILWDLVTGESECKSLNLLHGNDKSWTAIIQIGESYLMIPCWEKNIFISDNNGVNRIEYSYVENALCKEHETIQFSAVFCYKNEVYFQSMKNGQIFHYNSVLKGIEETNIEIEERIEREIKSRFLKRKNIGAYTENHIIGIDDFIRVI